MVYVSKSSKVCTLFCTVAPTGSLPLLVKAIGSSSYEKMLREREGGGGGVHTVDLMFMYHTHTSNDIHGCSYQVGPPFLAHVILHCVTEVSTNG